ncbi:MAG: MarR family winged helix-turn-helix transcriptional regulator [Vicinamibacterales bacterium]
MPRGLQAELKQSKPFGSPEEEVHLNIVRTAAVLEHRFARVLKPHDLTPTQYNVLRILRGAGANGLCRNEVGERLLCRVPDVTRLLDRMEESGLIARHRGGDDRRFVTTRITPHGLALLDRVAPDVEATHRAHLGHLDKARLRQLVELLTLVRQPG